MSKKNQNVQVEESVVEQVSETATVMEQPVEVSYPDDGSMADKLIIDHQTVSGAIRFLDSKGIERGKIAKILGRRYQHVRNVLITPLKKSS